MNRAAPASVRSSSPGTTLSARPATTSAPVTPTMTGRFASSSGGSSRGSSVRSGSATEPQPRKIRANARSIAAEESPAATITTAGIQPKPCARAASSSSECPRKVPRYGVPARPIAPRPNKTPSTGKPRPRPRSRNSSTDPSSRNSTPVPRKSPPLMSACESTRLAAPARLFESSRPIATSVRPT